MKGKYKRKKYWCDKCDANLPTAGMKCEVCGYINHVLKIKKPKSVDIIKKEIKEN